jgi:hypothetical protein
MPYTIFFIAYTAYSSCYDLSPGLGAETGGVVLYGSPRFTASWRSFLFSHGENWKNLPELQKNVQANEVHTAQNDSHRSCYSQSWTRFIQWLFHEATCCFEVAKT